MSISRTKGLTGLKKEVVGKQVIVKGFMTCTPRPNTTGVAKLRMLRCVGHMALRERVWRKHHLEGLRVDAGIILKWIWKNIKGVFGLDSCDPGLVKRQVLLNTVTDIHVPWNVGGAGGICHKILASQWEIWYIELIDHRMYLRQYARRDGDSAGGGSLFIILLPSAVINVRVTQQYLL